MQFYNKQLTSFIRNKVSDNELTILIRTNKKGLMYIEKSLK